MMNQILARRVDLLHLIWDGLQNQAAPRRYSVGGKPNLPEKARVKAAGD